MPASCRHMRTVSVRELKSNPSEALRDARDGPVLVLNRGVPEALIVTVAGDAAGIGLADRVGEAAEVMRGLADRGGARAVRAVERAAGASRRRRVSERRAVYDGLSAHALATLVATLVAIASPRRISIAGASGETTIPVVIIDLDREPERNQIGRIGHAVETAGTRVRIRTGAGTDTPETDEEIIFDRARVPLSVLDRLLADGRATAPRLQAPFEMPARAGSGMSASEALRQQREERR